MTGRRLEEAFDHASLKLRQGLTAAEEWEEGEFGNGVDIKTELLGSIRNVYH